MNVSIDLSVESPLWSAVADLETLSRNAIAAAMAESQATLPEACEVSCLFCDDDTIRALNARWRGIDKPTNVLSFPAEGPEAPGAAALLGDIVMAFETVAREAARDDTPIEAHVSHLVIHGFLHLIGYDHEADAEAEAMEALETRSMRRLGHPDPWLGRTDHSAGRDGDGPVMKDHERDLPPKGGESRIKAQDRPDRRQAAPSLLHRLRSVFGLGPASIRDDIEDALEETDTDDVFSPQERAMLRNVLGLHEVRVEDIMVPRADVIAVNTTMSLRDVLGVFRSAGHSRLPVHGDTLDDPRGMIHIRDFMDVVAGFITGADKDHPDLSISVTDANVIRPVLFAPPSMQAIDLLVKMQASRTHMALVIDEYGGTDGLVSIEDIVEVIVGDIEDEHDEDERPLIEPLPDGVFLADGRASLEDVSAALGVNLTGDDDADEVDTLGGFVTAMSGRVPHRGEVVTDREDFEFEILDADPRRVKSVKIRPRDTSRAGETAAQAPREDISTSSSPPDAGMSQG